MRQQAATGTAPDFAIIDSFFLSNIYMYLQPLDAYFPPDDIAKYVGFARKGMYGPDGKLKALWINTDVRELLYRPDLVPVPPKTWDELIAVGQELLKKGVTPYVYNGGRGEGTVMAHLPMFWAQGGEMVDDNGRPVFGEGKNREAWLNVLTFLQRTQDTGIASKRVGTYLSPPDLFPEVLRGNVAMVLGNSFLYKQLHDLGDKHVWYVADVPTKDGTQMTAAGGVTFGVFTPDLKKQSAIADLLKTLIESDTGMADAAAAIGNLPTKLSLVNLDTPYYQDPINKQFISMLSYARVRPGAAIYPAESAALGVAISEVVTGQKRPDQALDDAWQNVLQRYRP
jgi:multiple sugar transport system substrate-binding protein